MLLWSNVGGSESSCCHDDFFWQVSECFHDHRLYVACQTLKVVLTVLKIINYVKFIIQKMAKCAILSGVDRFNSVSMALTLIV